MNTRLAILLMMASIVPGGAHADPISVDLTDCIGPAGDPAPGTADWSKRDRDNALCMHQRGSDTATNPAYFFAAQKQIPLSNSGYDPFRDPADWDRVRGRVDPVLFFIDNDAIAGHVFRPCDATCDQPSGLPSHSPPYPGIAIGPGGGTYPEMYLWAAQGLAEAGYLVLTYDSTQSAAMEAGLEFLLSTDNPYLSELDTSQIGLAGHSLGASAASRIGQQDPRVTAIVGWDNLSAPASVTLRTPALGINSDLEVRSNGVYLPALNTAPPDPHAKDAGFSALREAGVDAMQVGLRAGTHLEFDHGLFSSGSRLGERVMFYYTLAWFDRYLKGATNPALAADALDRLTASSFDGSSDLHNISAGLFDAERAAAEGSLEAGNVPHRIEGASVRDRVSFYFLSSYWLDGGKIRCDDMRAGCSKA